MGKSAVFILFLFLSHFTRSQIIENFADGNFSSEPEWKGDTDHFVVEDQVLRLIDDEAGSSFLSTGNNRMNNTQWEFWIRLAFTPSDNNHPRIYLVSDIENLKAPLNGYYLQIGKSGTDNKRLYFYKQTGEESELLITGSQNIADNSNNILRIKVTLDNEGNWQIFADPDGGVFYLPQGEINDQTHTSTEWFGWVCNYTVSNASSFYLDDIYVGEIIVDETPPNVVSVTAPSANTLSIQFSEALTQLSAEDTENYFLDQDIGHPISAVSDPEDRTRVILSFDTEFESGGTYNLEIDNIEDLAGNIMDKVIESFTWYIPVKFDIVFNELMVDPTPETGLPPHEYIEIFNVSPYEINLKDWILQYGTTQKVLPEIIISPGGYKVLLSSGAAEDYGDFDHIVIVPGLSSSALTNSGNTLMLFDPGFDLISWVRYEESWYNDQEKAEGGWSLEKIDPYNFCSGANNWTSSNDINGGTPGYENSVFGENPDNTPPVFTGVSIINPLQLKLHFNETMDAASINDISNYTISADNIQIAGVSSNEPLFNQVILTITDNLAPGEIYEISLNENITDCAGNNPVEATSLFSDYTAKPGDIVFNEIMSDPSPTVGLPEAKYAEIINNTSYPVVLENWFISHGSATRQLPFIYLPPLGLALITTKEFAVMLQDFKNVYGINNLSSNFLTLGGLQLKLINPEGDLINSVEYSDRWYEDPLKAEGGWSLERIDPFNICGEKDNWTASVDSKGGTPGMTNSVRADNPDTINPEIIRTGWINENTISVLFDEIMDEETVLNTSNYTFEPNTFNIEVIEKDPDNTKNYFIELNYNIEKGIIYTLHANENIKDCAGNSLNKQAVRFGVPESADSAGIAINEILFNPAENGERYVEIYNRSDKIIDLKNYYLSSLDTIENIIEAAKVITPVSFLFFPEDYLVLTRDTSAVKEQYMTNNPDGFTGMDIPPMTISDGIIALVSRSQQIIDLLYYNEDMHYPLLTDKKGIALERINYNVSALQQSNWQSASASSGFGTPGYQNSQFRLSSSTDNSGVELEPDIFSPDNDGKDDVLLINYHFEQPGFTANIDVFDSRGRLVKRLIKSELLGRTGVFFWDGTTSSNQKAKLGIYIIFMEVFDHKGNIRTYKETAVLGGRL